MNDSRFDALLLLSFGGPEQPEDVWPFLQNVVRGKRVPEARLREVAERYHQMGGRSPINDQNRSLIRALEAELAARDIELPIFWGNRNWHPLLSDTLAQMKERGVRRALALVTSAFGSYSGCRQYQQDIERAREHVGAGAPEVAKLRLFYNHPGFIDSVAQNVAEVRSAFDADTRDAAHLVFTAHSIPLSMAETGPYVEQLQEAARLVQRRSGHKGPSSIAYQSRSGPPHHAWLEPDILDHLRALHAQGVRHVVCSPLGFVSDHMEVVWDLDVEAAQLSKELGLAWKRAATAGTHPSFVRGLVDLVMERLDPDKPRLAMGSRGPSPDVCPPDCCQ